MVAMVLESAMTVVDLFWVGRLGTVEVAAVTLGGNLAWVILSFAQLAAAGVLALVARAIGAKRPDAATRTTVSGVRLAVVVGTAFSLLGVLIPNVLIKVFGAPGEVKPATELYFMVMAVALPFLFAQVALRCAFQGAGDTKTPMRVLVAANLINLLADPCLIFGLGPIPAMGVAGAAIATAFSQCLGFVLLWRAARRTDAAISIRGHGSTELWPRMLRIGTPATAGWIARPLSAILLLGIVASFGTVAVAAFGIGMRIVGLVFIFYLGVAAAVSTLVGQSLGATEPDRARRVVRQAILISLGVEVVLSAIILFAAPWAIAIFRDDPQVVATGARYLRIIALGLMAMPHMSAYSAAFAGAGDTRPPMAAAIIANWAVKLPAAFALSRLIATDGVWWGITASIAAEAMVNAMWFSRERWKKVRP
jgi:putative MATE family efflux protein